MKHSYLFTTTAILLGCFFILCDRQNRTEGFVSHELESEDAPRKAAITKAPRVSGIHEVTTFLSDNWHTHIPCYPSYQKRYMYQHVPPTFNCTLDLRSQPYIPYESEKYGMLAHSGITGNYRDIRNCPKINQPLNTQPPHTQ